MLFCGPCSLKSACSSTYRNLMPRKQSLENSKQIHVRKQKGWHSLGPSWFCPCMWRSPTRFGGTDTGNSTFARQVGGHSLRVFRRNHFLWERFWAYQNLIVLSRAISDDRHTIERVCTSPRCRCALRYVCTSFCTRSAIESRLCKEPWLGNFKHGAEDLADTDRGQGQWDRHGQATRFWKVQQHSATLSSTLSDPVIFFNSHSS